MERRTSRESYLTGGVSLAGGIRFAESFAAVLELAQVGRRLPSALPSPYLLGGFRYESDSWTAGLDVGWDTLMSDALMVDCYVGHRFGL